MGGLGASWSVFFGGSKAQPLGHELFGGVVELTEWNVDVD